jgi:hypothetical protein
MAKLAVKLCIFVLLVVSLGLSAFKAYSQDDQKQLENLQKRLDMITETADKICGIVHAQGETKSVAIKGAVHAELQGLAAHLANLGVSGAGDILSNSYQGVLQEQLSATLKDEAACKSKVFDALQIKLLPGQPSGVPSEQGI